jgi:hypothetical protein
MLQSGSKLPSVGATRKKKKFFEIISAGEKIQNYCIYNVVECTAFV